MKIHKNNTQSGAASIMFAMFIVIIMSLLALGIAALVRNDQRQTVDKTLSNQAQYATETAINKIQSSLLNNEPLFPKNNKTDCAVGVAKITPIELGSSTTITCALWDDTPSSIVTDTSNKPSVFAVTPQGANIASIKIVWSDTENSSTSTYPDINQLRLDDTKIPVLKLTIGQISNISNTKSFYLVPYSSTNYNLAFFTSGSIIPASCSAGICTAIMYNMPGGTWLNGVKSAMISLQSFGVVKNVSFTGHSDNAGVSAAVDIAGAQASIDVTAKSQDVIKRVKATIPLGNDTWRPGFAVSAESLCKNYILDGVANNTADSTLVSNSTCP